MTRAFKLKCAKCGREYGADERLCLCREKDEGRLDIIYDYDTLNFPDKEERSMGVWRYHSLLPVEDERAMVTLGEGNTPLLRARKLADGLGMRNLFLKNEAGNPTGSFKDRSMAVGVAKALEFGFSIAVTASSGNAASALAAYSAASGVKCCAFVPERTPAEKVSQILLYGAKVFRVRPDQTLGDPTVKAMKNAVDRFGWYPCPSFGPFNPYQVEGAKTISYELVEQLEWRVPDWVLMPVGAACLLTGIWKGFKDLVELGVIKDFPRLVGIQPSKNAPFVRAFKRGTKAFTFENNRETTTIADALTDPFPWDGDAGLMALEQTNGRAEEVTDQELLEAEKLLAMNEGLFVSPSGVAGLAGLLKLKSGHQIDKRDTVVVLLTDCGFKNMMAAGTLAGRCPVIDPTLEDMKQIGFTDL
jgi:threonine synthase